MEVLVLLLGPLGWERVLPLDWASEGRPELE